MLLDILMQSNKCRIKLAINQKQKYCYHLNKFKKQHGNFKARMTAVQKNQHLPWTCL